MAEPVTPARILALFRSGLNTVEIVERLGLRRQDEAIVVRRLAQAREQKRQAKQETAA